MDLYRIGVLIFIHQDVLELLLQAPPDALVAMQQVPGKKEDVIIVYCVGGPEDPLVLRPRQPIS